MAVLASVSAHADTFDFSYTFNDGPVITGSLSGTLVGGAVQNISDVHVALDGTAEQLSVHRRLCAATLTLDRVIRFQEMPPNSGVRQGIIFYTYHVTTLPWASSPEARKVFPMVDRVIQGEGRLQLEQRLELAKEGWTARGVQ
jgi:hypothetical protein